MACIAGMVLAIAVDKKAGAPKSVCSFERCKPHNQRALVGMIEYWAYGIATGRYRADIGDLALVGVVLPVAVAGIPRSQPQPIVIDRACGDAILPGQRLDAPRHVWGDRPFQIGRISLLGNIA